MSIAQVKKRFEELAEYLGRDTKGLEKLRDLKAAVNVLRVKLAAAEEAEATASISKQTAIREADDAKALLTEAQQENHRLTQKLYTAERLVESTAEYYTKKYEAEDDVEPATKKPAQAAATVRELKKHLKKCPPATEQGAAVVFAKEDISPGWSRQELWTLGASVALISAIGGQVIISSSDNIHDVLTEESDRVKAMEWFAANLGTSVVTDFDQICHGNVEPPPYLRKLGFPC